MFCVPKGAMLMQLVRVVEKYLREHPEQLHIHQAALVTKALQVAFPCR